MVAAYDQPINEHDALRIGYACKNGVKTPFGNNLYF